MRLFVFLMALVVSMNAWAVQPDEILPDPAMEARARALSKELRCLVCRNQSIDDSDAELARDLRLFVRERISSGESDAQVMAAVEARYGEYVFLTPRFNWANAPLWFGGPLLLLVGLMLFYRRGGRKEAVEAPDSLTPEEKARLAAILHERKKRAQRGE